MSLSFFTDAIEELVTYLSLKLLQLNRERRRGHVQTGRGAGEPALVSNHPKVPKVIVVQLRHWF